MAVFSIYIPPNRFFRIFVAKLRQNIMDTLIGRNEEIREINELYDSGKAEFLAVYGRRRVGKTYLIKEVLGSKRMNLIVFSIRCLLMHRIIWR